MFALIAILLFIAFWSFRIVPEYKRIVVYRFGRLVGTKGPGITLLIPIIEAATTVDIRTIAMEVPPQEVITKDNVPIKVDAVVYFKVVDPAKALTQVENYVHATSQYAQTTLRSILGQVELDDSLSKRDELNHKLQLIIDEATEPWGIKVISVELKTIELPDGMKRAMAKQAEAERERRAKIISAEGEYQAAEKLSEAASLIGKVPGALQLRFLQTLVEISAEKNSTILFPFPIDLVKPFLNKLGASKDENDETIMFKKVKN